MKDLISQIDQNIGGDPLSGDIIKSFDTAYHHFLQEGMDEDDKRQKIGEIAKLLEITTDNLKEMEGQNAFQRAWKTISGSNKKLMLKSEQNLLQIQKGALYFLLRSTENDIIMKQTVAQALRRVCALQIQHAQIRKYLIELSDTLIDRQDHIDSRLDNHERQLSALSRKVPLWRKFVFYILFGWIWGFELLPEQNTSSSSEPPKGPNRQEVNESDYLKLADDFIEKLVSLVKEERESNLNNEKMFFDDLPDLVEAISAAGEFAESEEKEKESFIKSLGKFIRSTKINVSSIQSSLREVVKEKALVLANSLQDLAKHIGLSDSELLELQPDYVEIDKFCQQIINASTSICRKIEEMEELRYSLHQRLNNCEKIVRESVIKAIGKDFLEKITFGLIHVYSKDVEFIQKYDSDLQQYQNCWRDLGELIELTDKQIDYLIEGRFINECNRNIKYIFKKAYKKKIPISEIENLLENEFDTKN